MSFLSTFKNMVTSALQKSTSRPVSEPTSKSSPFSSMSKISALPKSTSRPVSEPTRMKSYQNIAKYENMMKSYQNIAKRATRPVSYSTLPSYSATLQPVSSYLQPSNERQQQTIQSIVNTIPVKRDFRDVMKYEDYFDPSQANESALYRTKRYYEPLIEKALKNINKQYAEGGLFRSGMRTNAQSESARDFASNEEEMRRQLINQADLEARQQYSEQQRLYEASPTSYVAPATTPKISFGTAQTVPESYGTTYTDWINQLLKKY